VILDDADYDAFVQQYEHFRQDWETLDKVQRGLSMHMLRPCVLILLYYGVVAGLLHSDYQH
jgi:hypothetical protein